MDPEMLDEMYKGAQAQVQFFINGSTVLAALASAAVLLRLLARWRSKSSYGADDLLISLSLVPLWCSVIAGAFMAQEGGMGLSSEFLSPAQSDVFYNVLFASFVLYALSITIVKISILQLYRRVFTIGPFRNLIYIVGGMCLAWFIVVVCVSLFQCRPIAAAWDRTIAGKCMDLKVLYYGITISNMILDLVINLMPVKMIWKLQLSLKQRILLLCIMLVGIIVVTASAGRIGSVPYLVESDVSATIMMPFLYTIIEPAFAIICACLPTYRPLFIWISVLVPYHCVSSNVRSWFRGPKGRDLGSTSGTPLFAHIRSPITPNTGDAYSPHFNTSEKWPGISFPEISSPRYIHGSLFPFDPPSVPPKGALQTWVEIPPRTRKYDETWPKAIVTGPCDNGAIYGHDDDSWMMEFSPRNAHDSITFV